MIKIFISILLFILLCVVSFIVRMKSEISFFYSKKEDDNSKKKLQKLYIFQGIILIIFIVWLLIMKYW